MARGGVRDARAGTAPGGWWRRPVQAGMEEALHHRWERSARDVATSMRAPAEAAAPRSCWPPQGCGSTVRCQTPGCARNEVDEARRLAGTRRVVYLALARTAGERWLLGISSLTTTGHASTLRARQPHARSIVRTARDRRDRASAASWTSADRTPGDTSPPSQQAVHSTSRGSHVRGACAVRAIWKRASDCRLRRRSRHDVEPRPAIAGRAEAASCEGRLRSGRPGVE